MNVRCEVKGDDPSPSFHWLPLDLSTSARNRKEPQEQNSTINILD